MKNVIKKVLLRTGSSQPGRLYGRKGKPSEQFAVSFQMCHSSWDSFQSFLVLCVPHTHTLTGRGAHMQRVLIKTYQQAL